MDVFPFKPGDWAADHRERVAKVKAVYEGEPGEVLLDLVIYSSRGEKLGRTSPVCGGPRTFEPACLASGWERIAEPRFPIVPKWIPNADGGATLGLWAADRLPPANWRKPARKAKLRVPASDNDLRAALEAIADGHNDARQLAIDVLTRKGYR